MGLGRDSYKFEFRGHISDIGMKMMSQEGHFSISGNANFSCYGCKQYFSGSFEVSSRLMEYI